MATADCEVEAAGGFHRLAGPLGHERGTGAGHRVRVGEGLELMVHDSCALFQLTCAHGSVLWLLLSMPAELAAHG